MHRPPLRATDLSGLPPSLVLLAEYDPLRDEGERYARCLHEAGAPTRLSECHGINHGFFGNLGIYDQSAQALDEASAWLKEIFSMHLPPAPFREKGEACPIQFRAFQVKLLPSKGTLPLLAEGGRG